MKPLNQHKSNQKFLEESFSKGLAERHSKYLGSEIPEGYFASSKVSILEKIKQESALEAAILPKKQQLFWLRPQFKFAVAASIVCLLAMTIWFQNANQSENKITNDFELMAFTDEVLINSLLIDDSQLEDFTNITLMNEIVLKAELSEQKIDNLFLNSLFVEDSLIDTYTDKNLLETIIL